MKVAILVLDDRDVFRRYADPEPYFAPAPSALLQGFAEIPSCEIHIVSCTQKPLATPAKLADNIHFHSLLVPTWGWMRGGYLGCVLAIRRKLREIRPDIVHGQGTERYCALAAAFSGRPNVVTVHGNMRAIARGQGARPFSGLWHSYLWVTAQLEAFALPRTHGVFCNSEYTGKEVHPLARRIWHVPNALRKEFFAATPLPKEANVPPRLLNIGNVFPYKHQVEILGVARDLHRRGVRFELVFLGNVGDSPYVTEFRARLREAEQAGYARFLGFMETGELICCLDGADALVHFSSEESFGLVVAEALTRNLKFFGARTGGVLDIATGVEGAELLDAQDWAGLGRAIERWITAGCPRPAGATAVMQSRYHPQVVARRHLEIYEEVLRTVA